MLPPEYVAEPEKAVGSLHQRLQRFVQRIVASLSIALKIKPKRGALGTGSLKPADEARAVFEEYPDSLAGTDAAVHRIRVLEVVGQNNR